MCVCVCVFACIYVYVCDCSSTLPLRPFKRTASHQLFSVNLTTRDGVVLTHKNL